MTYFTYQELDANALRREFESASPFPHVVIDDFVAVEPDGVLQSFPPEEWLGWSRFTDEYQHKKLSCADITAIPGPLRSMIDELHAPPFLGFLEQVTGIDKLLPDPYLKGGGLHLSGPGGVLVPHTDFHTYGELDLYRQVNVLVYLNPAWDEAWGGCLELFEDPGAERASRRVVPTWGTCVVFRTDDRSVHGFPAPIADDRWRRSIALYYYTSSENAAFSGDGITYWRSHGTQRTTRDKLRLAGYRALVKASKACSVAAHRLNPNFDR